MASRSASVVICGAGIAGVAAAFELAVRHGLSQVVVVDERKPLSLTSAQGDVGYHSFFPGPDGHLARFMHRSLDLLEQMAEESGNVFGLNRRGCVYLTGEAEGERRLSDAAERLAELGLGPVRRHPSSDSPLPRSVTTHYQPSPPEGFRDAPEGCDLVLGWDRIHHHFPFVSQDARALLHVRRAGWLHGRRLGGWMLERAQAHGVEVLRDRVEEVRLERGRVEKVILRSGTAVATDRFVAAAGPQLRQVAALLGLELPVLTELQGRMIFRERLGILPAQAPLLVWDDPIFLRWSDVERAQLQKLEETRRLLGQLPRGIRVRPYDEDGGGLRLLIHWAYGARVQQPLFPPGFEPLFAEILLRGLVRMVPGLFAYFGYGGEGQVEGGYLTKAPDERPLIGALEPAGAYVLGALAEHGVMAAPAAAELLAAAITGGELPSYAAAFEPSRFGALRPIDPGAEPRPDRRLVPD